MSDAALSLSHMSKAYPGVQALDNVWLNVSPGEVHGLVGENGAGKSTLIKILAGVVRPDQGNVRLNGDAVEIRSAEDAKQHGLAFIHQELNLIEYFTAPQNVFLGHSMPTRYGLFSRNRLRRQAAQIFETLGADVPLSEPVRYLTPGQRAMVAIGRAFAHDATVYFMDEPGTALAAREKNRLFRLIRQLREQGKSVVYVTHNLEDVLALSDRVTVLREGRTVGDWETRRLTRDALIEAMIGEAATAERRGRATAPREAPLLEVAELSGNGVGPVNFALHAGEVLGIGGLVGAGRTELLRLLYGDGTIETGSVRIGGRNVNLRSPGQAVQAGMGLIPEERRSEGLALQRSVLENILPCSLRRFSRAGLVQFRALEDAGWRTGERVKLKTASYRNPVKTLSGGNQQKVIFARALLAQPAILLLDEPTKGVDVGARFEIYDLMRELADGGVGLILVSSDFEEMLTLADRLLFLRNGKQGATVENSNMDQQQYLRLCYQGAEHE